MRTFPSGSESRVQWRQAPSPEGREVGEWSLSRAGTCTRACTARIAGKGLQVRCQYECNRTQNELDRTVRRAFAPAEAKSVSSGLASRESGEQTHFCLTLLQLAQAALLRFFFSAPPPFPFEPVLDDPPPLARSSAVRFLAVPAPLLFADAPLAAFEDEEPVPPVGRGRPAPAAPAPTSGLPPMFTDTPCCPR